MQLILENDEAWSLMTIFVSQMIDKPGVSADAKAKLRRWRTDRSEKSTEMQELSVRLNEALGSTLDERTYRLIRGKGGYVPSAT
jgi:hypothetical protein